MGCARNDGDGQGIQRSDDGTEYVVWEGCTEAMWIDVMGITLVNPLYINEFIAIEKTRALTPVSL